MTNQLADRWWLAATGAVGGALMWAVVDAAQNDVIGSRLALVLGVFVATFFASTLATAGPIGLVRSLPRALGLAVLLALLIWLAGLRYEQIDGILDTPMPFLAAVVAAALPVPFMIAEARDGWRSYPHLFQESWSIVMRSMAAAAFAGLVWLVIFLSDQVLQIVGITVIARLMEYWLLIMALTGAIAGLAMAVIYEMADTMPPHLILRLFRLLTPAVLAVMVVFLIALPFRGLEGLASGLSPTFLLLTMIGAGVSLVSITIDHSDETAAESVTVLRSAQVMAVVLPILAALAVWSIWLRVGQHGWSPERLFVTVLAAIGLGYGLIYAVSVLRGPGWMRRIRRGNVAMALAAWAVAALWLTPILNAERISAQSQLARYLDGRTAAADLDLDALRNWGRPGRTALAELQRLSETAGHEALGRMIRAEAPQAPRSDEDRLQMAVDLAALIPVQPTSATGSRDTLLAAAESGYLSEWTTVCSQRSADGKRACLMVVADLLPTLPGEEALLFLSRADHTEVLGLYIHPDHGTLETRLPTQADGDYIGADSAAALMEAWRDTPPPLTPAPINQLGTGDTGLMLLR